MSFYKNIDKTIASHDDDLVCIIPDGYFEFGRVYSVVISGRSVYFFREKNGKIIEGDRDNFITLEEWRNRQINNII
jgi:hypothetical protein